MERRKFIRQTAGAAAFTALGGLTLPSFSSKEGTKITILHTNDTHSHIDPFEASHYKYANQGGIARRASVITKIRKENPNTLLLDAGDIFQGTPYFNYFGGELEFKLMSTLRYDAATIGNHDFDNSIDGLYKQLPHAKFSFLSANYDFKNTVLDTFVKPYQVFIRDGIKIGVFGLGVELTGLVDPKMFKETKYLDPISISQDMSRILKEDEQCDLIICLSHLGYYYKKNPTKISDVNLAKVTRNIDLIIGGHTHTFLPKPTLVKNLDDKNVLVNQVGAYGVNLGRIDFYFDANNNQTSEGKVIIL